MGAPSTWYLVEDFASVGNWWRLPIWQRRHDTLLWLLDFVATTNAFRKFHKLHCYTFCFRFCMTKGSKFDPNYQGFAGSAAVMLLFTTFMAIAIEAPANQPIWDTCLQWGPLQIMGSFEPTYGFFLWCFLAPACCRQSCLLRPQNCAFMAFQQLCHHSVRRWRTCTGSLKKLPSKPCPAVSPFSNLRVLL